MVLLDSLSANYTGYDSIISTDISRQVAARTNFTGTFDLAQNIDVDPENIRSLVDAQSIPGHIFDDVDKIESYLKNKFDEYQQQTTNLLTLNNLINANGALYDNMSQEYNRTTNLRDKSTSSVQKMRQAHVIKKYSIGSMFFWGNMIQFSMAFLIACIVLVVLVYDPDYQLNVWVAAIAAGILFLFWIIVFILLFKQNSMRRKDDWNKYYFPTKNIKDALSCRVG